MRGIFWECKRKTQSMDTGGVRSVVLFVVFLCAMAARNLEGKLLGNGITWNIRDMNQEKAEQVWIHYKKELKDNMEAFEDFDPSLPQAITDLPPQVKQNIFDCLRKNNFPFHASGKEVGTKTWFIECLPLPFGWPNVPRRHLISRSRDSKAVSPAPASSFPRNSWPPARTPNPPLLPPPLADENPPPGPLGSPIPHSEYKSTIRKYIIVTIASVVVAILSLTALLLFCLCKGNENKIAPIDGQRDEKPLLHSAGSPQKYQNVGNASNRIFKTMSFANNSATVAVIPDSSLVNTQSSQETTVASEDTEAPLPLPPGRTAPPPPGPPPPPPPKPPAPRPPPPPKKVVQPPPLPSKSGNPTKLSPLVPHHHGHSSSAEGNDLSTESVTPKTKLKPFFWDKVLASPNHSMVWHELRTGSFQFNEERIESLFCYTPPASKNRHELRKDFSSSENSTQYVQIIDAKKSQNLAILLKSLHVTTEEVCDALKNGNELPAELVQTLLKMAPTTEEELKLRSFSGKLSQLGPAERFLKIIAKIPFAFKRLESILFMSYLQEEVSSIKESFATLEVACKELRSSRLFLKLLEAVLKTGNRMNDGTFRGGAQAFKLDTLLKLSDVKGTDGKTTLLHFVVEEILRSEGVRAARTARESQRTSSTKKEDLIEDSTQETDEYYRSLGLQVVSGLGNVLRHVKKAALIDGDTLPATISKLSQSLSKAKEFLNTEMESIEEESEFHDTLAGFVQHANVDITWLQEEEKRIMALVKSTADYFHGDAGKDEGLRLFVIVRDFLIMLDKACKEVRNSETKSTRTSRKEASTVSPSQESRQPSRINVRERLFPSIRNNSRMDFERFSP
ncbi:formin-like protein 3 [Cornus florida]|uniref:formin-like protein 3 n=1 Tax=Cornus florida TaxID=4283 RepID=UPI0028A00197|nr:formin-like protein 3 [Cornus florida]